MTQEITEMAKQAGLDDDVCSLHEWEPVELIAFAKLVAAQEREACAKTVEMIETYEKIEKACFKFAAKTIRARGNT
jgi:3-hydroxyacyl-CoA dehydrogenase